MLPRCAARIVGLVQTQPAGLASALDSMLVQPCSLASCATGSELNSNEIIGPQQRHSPAGSTAAAPPSAAPLLRTQRCHEHSGSASMMPAGFSSNIMRSDSTMAHAAAEPCSPQPRHALHTSAATAAAQAASAATDESAAADDYLAGAPGNLELTDMIEPEFLQTPAGQIAFHALPATGSHLTGIIYCGGLNSNMTGIKATMLDMHARRNRHPYVRFDYRGHGASSGEFLETTLGDWYEDTLHVIDNVALPGQHILVGSSIGAWIALKAAAARRERIKGLVLLAPAVDITELWWQALPPAEQAEARATGLVQLGGGTQVRLAFFEEASDHCLLDVGRKDAQVRCPVRILHGAADTIVPPFVASEVVAWCESRDVHLTMIKDGDHRLSRPEDLRTLMLAVEELLALDTQRVSSA